MRFNYLKKIVPSVVLLALCLSLLPIGTPLVHAATVGSVSYDKCVGSTTTGGLGGTYKEDSSGAGKSSGTCTTPDGSTTKVGSLPDETGCNFTTATTNGVGLTAAICITNVIYVFTVGIGSTFAYVAAFFFDMAIQLSLQSTAYALNFISTGWELARDIANMAFIFILLFIAIKVMLNANDRTTSSMLVGVIIVALLVNFSFFFTRVVIDAGNLLSVQFYNAIPCPPGNCTLADTYAKSNLANATTLGSGITALASNGEMKDLTYSIMQMMQLQSLFSTGGFQSYATSGNQGFLSGFISLTFLYIAAGVLFWGLIVTFITVGIKFLMRIIVLWFLIIASPLAFIAYAIPNSKVSGKFNEWLSELVKHAFYPVGFMFVFFILTLFSSQLAGSNTAGDGGLINGIFTNLQNMNQTNWLQIMAVAVANVAIRMGFVLGVMYIGMKASEYIGVMGGDFAKKWGQNIGNSVLKYGPGWAAGAAYRRTGGAAAAGLGRSLDTGVLSKWANRTGTFGGLVGYRLRQGLEPLTKTSLGTFASDYRGREKFLEDRRKSMDSNLDNRLGYIKNRDESRELVKLDQQWAPLDNSLQTLDKSVGPRTPAQIAERARLVSEMDKLRPRREQLISNVGKIETAHIVDLKAADIENIIKHVSDKQVKAIKESLKFSNMEKENIERKWHEESRKAPLGESKEHLKKLGEIETTLSGLGIGLTKLQAYTKPAPGATVDINLGTAKSLKKELEDEMDKQDNIKDDTGKLPAERTTARQAHKALKKAVERIEKLEEQVRDVPEKVGDAKPEGEFKHKA